MRAKSSRTVLSFNSTSNAPAGRGSLCLGSMHRLAGGACALVQCTGWRPGEPVPWFKQYFQCTGWRLAAGGACALGRKMGGRAPHSHGC